jgi:hypothetical protein
MKFGAALILGAFLFYGCLPLPTIPHGLGVVLDKEAFESLRPGEVSRADVLLALGEPRHRLEKDRFLMYEWTVAYGYVIVGGPCQALPIPVTAPHYLCLEFGLDSSLLRREHFRGSLYANPKKAIRKCICADQPEEIE